MAWQRCIRRSRIHELAAIAHVTRCALVPVGLAGRSLPPAEDVGIARRATGRGEAGQPFRAVGVAGTRPDGKLLESLTERPLTAVVVAGAPSPGKRNVADPLSPANSSRPDPAGTPRVIADRYQILRLLGEGASARTLLCSDLRENRRVAIKELHLARLGDWKHLELFEREART